MHDLQQEKSGMPGSQDRSRRHIRWGQGIVATLIGRSNRAFDAPDAMASSVPVALLSRVDVMILRSSANAADLRATVA